jgi:glycosyltransferase involved in cell wall biosynthesis
MGLKRVLICNTAQSLDLIGGSQAAIEDAIDVLIEENWQVDYVSMRYKIDDKVIVNSQLTRYFLGNLSVGILQFFKELFLLISILKNNKYDLVWINSAKPWIFLGPFLSFDKSVYTFHGPILEEQRLSGNLKLKQSVSKFIYKIICNNIDIIHFNTNYVKEAVLMEFRFLINKKSIVKEVLVSEKNLKTKVQKFIQHDLVPKRISILIPRRLVTRTGVLKFLNFVTLIDANIRNKFHFYISGDGPERDRILQLVSIYPNFEYLGLLKEKDFDYYFFNANVICIPSVGAEGFCLPARNAVLLNKTVLSTSQGGLKETLHDYENALDFSFNSIESLEQSLKVILEGSRKNISNLEGESSFRIRLHEVLLSY